MTRWLFWCATASTKHGDDSSYLCIYQRKLPIVGVGGIMNADDAWEKITAGATLIQAYAGFVFEGPGLTKAIVHGLHKRMKSSGFSSITEAIGSANK